MRTGTREEPHDPPAGDAALLREAADRLEALAATTTPGDWRLGGLLASRPEVVAPAPAAAPSTSPRRAPGCPDPGGTAARTG
ncbi:MULTISPECIES: hypothetical protein [unclassified Blastococcus]|uniref:hypothetical protein n=1 Tax=unclassified Blastococcus TaxID=2619396 RepID=UPI001EEF9091|nr:MULTISPECIES: hypothetical protein [unclassified Blastococcus]